MSFEAIINVFAVNLSTVNVPLLSEHDIEGFVYKNSLNKKKTSRTSSNFLIYRTKLLRELQTKGYCLKMADVSSLASDKWSGKPEEVKIAFNHTADEIRKRCRGASLSEKKEGKKQRKGRKKSENSEEWNIISFPVLPRINPKTSVEGVKRDGKKLIGLPSVENINKDTVKVISSKSPQPISLSSENRNFSEKYNIGAEFSDTKRLSTIKEVETLSSLVGSFF